MARKMTLKFCPACGRSYRSRRSLVRHMEGYTKKFVVRNKDGKRIPGEWEPKVIDPCTGPKPERAPITFQLPLDAYYPNAINIGLAIPSDHPFTSDPRLSADTRKASMLG